MEIKEAVSELSPISLEMMERVKLMDRTDVKYIINDSILPELLFEIKDDYHILETANTRMASYQTLYFDTPKNKFYKDHHNGKRNRYKVRYRTYIESELSFFEIKHKSKKGRIIKDRIKVDSIKRELEEEEWKLVEEKMKKRPNLEARLENTFRRMTLIAKNGIERMTIDFDLQFQYNQQEQAMPSLAVIEVKQERYSRDSRMMDALRKRSIRPERMSKYALGMSIFSGEKANRFKAKHIRINKITADDRDFELEH